MLLKGQVRSHIDSFSHVATQAATMPTGACSKSDVREALDGGEHPDFARVGQALGVEPASQKLDASSHV